MALDLVTRLRKIAGHELDHPAAEAADEIEQLRSALAGEIGLVQLLAARSELQPDRQTVLGNHRHVEALRVLGDSDDE